MLTGISGVEFDSAWPNRVEVMLEQVRVPVLGLDDLVANKRASGRDRDHADLKGLQGRTDRIPFSRGTRGQLRNVATHGRS
jgi:hypothetical protein